MWGRHRRPYRLDGMLAILSAKLPHLPDWTEARQEAANADTGLNHIEDVVVPSDTSRHCPCCPCAISTLVQPSTSPLLFGQH
jgi:hypothetical protein